MSGWGWGGILGAPLALVAGEVLLTATTTSGSGASQLLSLAQAPAGLAAKWMDPGVPLIKRRQAGATTAKTVSKTTTATSTAAGTIAQTT